MCPASTPEKATGLLRSFPPPRSHLSPICHGQVLDLPAHVVEGKSVVIPLLPEGDLKAQLHIINLLKTPDKDIDQNLSRNIIIYIVHTKPLGPDFRTAGQGSSSPPYGSWWAGAGGWWPACLAAD